jgi:hypothetical protein
VCCYRARRSAALHGNSRYCPGSYKVTRQPVGRLQPSATVHKVPATMGNRNSTLLPDLLCVITSIAVIVVIVSTSSVISIIVVVFALPSVL